MSTELVPNANVVIEEFLNQDSVVAFTLVPKTKTPNKRFKTMATKNRKPTKPESPISEHSLPKIPMLENIDVKNNLPKNPTPDEGEFESAALAQSQNSLKPRLTTDTGNLSIGDQGPFDKVPEHPKVTVSRKKKNKSALQATLDKVSLLIKSLETKNSGLRQQYQRLEKKLGIANKNLAKSESSKEQLQTEVDQLKTDNGQLKNFNDQLKFENEQLRVDKEKQESTLKAEIANQTMNNLKLVDRAKEHAKNFTEANAAYLAGEVEIEKLRSIITLYKKRYEIYKGVKMMESKMMKKNLKIILTWKNPYVGDSIDDDQHAFPPTIPGWSC